MLMKMHKFEGGVFCKTIRLQCERQKRRHSFVDASHSFVNLLLIAMVFNVAIGAFLTDINKGYVLKRGTPFS